MTAATARLEYMRGFLSRGEIMTMTGVHWTRIEGAIRGTVDLIVTERENIMNAYSRFSYAQLRESGMSASQAGRFRGYTPTSLTQRIETMGSLITRLTEGSIKAKEIRENRLITGQEYVNLYDDLEQSILEGLQTSRKTYENWLDYGRF